MRLFLYLDENKAALFGIESKDSLALGYMAPTSITHEAAWSS